MRKDTLNFLVDLAGLLAMLVLIGTGLVNKWVLPPGSHGGRGLSLWGMTRHEWGDAHFWAAVVLVALLILHVILHWTWVCVVVQRWLRPAGAPPAVAGPRVRTAVGVLFAIVLAAAIGGFYWLARGQVQAGGDDEPARRGFRGGRGAQITDVEHVALSAWPDVGICPKPVVPAGHDPIMVHGEV